MFVVDESYHEALVLKIEYMVLHYNCIACVALLPHDFRITTMDSGAASHSEELAIAIFFNRTFVTAVVFLNFVILTDSEAKSL